MKEVLGYMKQKVNAFFSYNLLFAIGSFFILLITEICRSRRASAVDQSQAVVGVGQGRRRHLSMQDRLEVYNTKLAREQEELR